MTREDVTLAVTTATATAGWYHAHLPPIYELWDQPDGFNIRATQAQVSGLVLLFALGVSAIAGTPAPILGAAVVGAAFLAQYELAIRG